MDVLPLNFRTLKHCGLWTDLNESSSRLKSAYAIFVSVIVYYFAFSLIAGSLMITTVDAITENLFVTVTYSIFCLKVFNFSIRQQEMRKLLAKFRSEVCQPRSPAERAILKKYKDRAANIYIYFVGIGLPTCIIFIALPLLKLINNEMELPFRTYQPVDTTKVKYFVLIYAIQSVTELYGLFLNISLDTMTSGFLILASGQFELCSHRLLQDSTGEKDTTRNDWIGHHVLILDIVKRTEAFFINVIVPFLLGCLCTMCTSIYQMSQLKPTSMEFISPFMYSICLLFEILLYCWYGNELQFKSQRIVDAAYGSDWVKLEPHDRKNICLAMLVGQKASKISYHGQCTLSLDTFVWILKTAYAAFSLLKRVS